ncbi:barstar family protein [Streptomyces yangpuensis]|uniref:barstar family protein n=1 Tax=Streptomyces yangpuensis TaxID=1648182 RepID=UPI000699F11B|nr:barstar family protein [Streptomyces yangpuensis]
MRAVVHDPPWLHVIAAGGALPVDLLLPATGTTYVARVDGREMADLDGVFQSFYDGLRLPDYFGWNWNALHDCLRDLHWLPAEHRVLIVEAADEALPDDPDERLVLFRALLRAGRRWSYTRKPDGVELGRLVLVLYCDAGTVPSLREQLQSCWAEVTASPS